MDELPMWRFTSPRMLRIEGGKEGSDPCASMFMNKGSGGGLNVDCKNERHWVVQTDGMCLQRMGLLRGGRRKILWRYQRRAKRTYALFQALRYIGFLWPGVPYCGKQRAQPPCESCSLRHRKKQRVFSEKGLEIRNFQLMTELCQWLSGRAWGDRARWEIGLEQ